LEHELGELGLCCRVRWDRAVWGPTYLVLLAAAVLSPLTFSCAPLSFITGLSAWDFTLNVALFVPLAGLVHRRHRWRAVLFGLLLSVGIECLQRYLFRSPNPWDVLANTLGAVVGALMPLERIAHHVAHLPARVWCLGCGLAAVIGGQALIHASTSPALPSFESWSPMDLVLGCEQDTKPSFGGTLRGLAVFDRAVHPGPAENLAALNAPGRIWSLDFTRQEAFQYTGPQTSSVALSPPPSVLLMPDGLRFEDGCWYLDAGSAEHIRKQLMPTQRLSIALELSLPDRPEPQRARIFALTKQHSTWNFSLGHEGQRLILWVRLGSIPDAYDDPLGETGLLPVTPGEQGLAVFALDDTRIRGTWNGQCRRERLYVMLGRHFLVGRGMGFSLAVLVALGAISSAWGLGTRLGAASALPGGLTMMGWLRWQGALEPMRDLQWNLLTLGLVALVGVMLSVRATRRPTSAGESDPRQY